MEEEIDQYTQSYLKAKPLLYELSFEGAVVFHGISILLCRKLLDSHDFAKYHNAFVTLLKARSQKSSQTFKEQSIGQTKEKFEKLKKRILEELDDVDPYRRRSLIGKVLFTLATDLALEYVNTTNRDKIMHLYKGMSQFRHGVNSNKELESLAFVLYQSAKEEYETFNWPIDDSVDIDEDWTDEADDPWNESQEDWDTVDDYYYQLDLDNGFSEEELFREAEKVQEETEEYVNLFTERLRNLTLERDIVFHALAIDILRRTTRPRIYAKYWNALKELVSNYRDREDKEADSLSETRKAPDELCIRKVFLMNRWSDYRGEQVRLDKFYLASKAIEMCYGMVEDMSQEEVEGIIDGLTFNEITKDYSSQDVEEIAKKCINFANQEILQENKPKG